MQVSSPPPAYPRPQPPQKKKLPKGWIIALVLVLVVGVGFVLLLAAGVGGYLLYRRSGSQVSGALPASPRSGLTGAAPADDVETPQPNSAQAAAVAGGQSAEWEQQEISWTVPQRWGRQSVSGTSLLWRSPGSRDAASLIGSVSPMSGDFPAEVSLNAFHQQALQRKASGEVNEVRWMKIDGVKGVLFREAAPEDADSPQRLQWIAYRDYKGQKQMLNIILASRGKDFARHEDALYGILYSMKLTR